MLLKSNWICTVSLLNYLKIAFKLFYGLRCICAIARFGREYKKRKWIHFVNVCRASADPMEVVAHNSKTFNFVRKILSYDRNLNFHAKNKRNFKYEFLSRKSTVYQKSNCEKKELDLRFLARKFKYSWFKCNLWTQNIFLSQCGASRLSLALEEPISI